MYILQKKKVLFKIFIFSWAKQKYCDEKEEKRSIVCTQSVNYVV